MILVVVLLGAVAVADLVAGGLAGEPRGAARSVAGIIAAAIAAAAAAASWALGAAVVTASAGLATATTVAWQVARLRRPLSLVRAWSALGGLAAGLLIAAAAGGVWGERLPALHSGTGDPLSMAAALGVLLFLAGTSNGIVRAVLAAAGPEIAGSPSRLRAGRLIGTVERVLIFGLALAGHPTAAALVASAKSILRFPELSRGARAEGPEGVDPVSEYFLLGSLVSWLLALAPAILFA
jgi:hypothetical protein